MTKNKYWFGSQLKIKIHVYVVFLQAANADALLLEFLEMWDINF